MCRFCIPDIQEKLKELWRNQQLNVPDTEVEWLEKTKRADQRLKEENLGITDSWREDD